MRSAPHATERFRARVVVLGAGALLAAGIAAGVLAAPSSRAPSAFAFNDSHFHLTNYVQKGIDVQHMLELMGQTVSRSTLFGVPLQQEWSHRITGSFAPTYYLDTDAPLYYYSFTDAAIAMAYRSLDKEERARFDPMITGFNPADMYAADHIRRVLLTFPGVFSGIGEFTIHKEFVSSKIAGSAASLSDPALDRVLDLAAEVGLVVLFHNDIDMPLAKSGSTPVYLGQLKSLFRRHPRTTIIWAHLGVGRIVHPVEDHAAMVRSIVQDPGLTHVFFDLSWSEAAKYLVASEASTRVAADVIQRHPDRFLFGTDEVAPPDRRTYLRVFEQYGPLWRRLDQGARDKVLKLNYQRLFDEARRRVRAWERRHAHTTAASALPGG